MRYLLMIFALVASTMANSGNAVLCDEITLNPLGRAAYGAGDAHAIADDLNTPYRSRWKSCVEGVVMRDQIDGADWVGISTDAQRDRLISVLDGCVNPQGFARARVIEILGAGSQSLSNMAAIAQESITRATELGLSTVSAGAVQSACQ